ncbi:unnamed protein product, partial [Bubo scandiacus]
MAGWGCRGAPVPRGGPHGAGGPWQLLLLAWLSLGCGVGTAQPLLGPAGSRRGVSGGPGDPGAPAPAPAATASRSAPGGACDPPRRSRARATRGSTGSASSRAAPAAPCPSVPCSAPSTTTSPSWARRPATAGCPSTEPPTSATSTAWPWGHNFYYTFGRVLDGTRCGPGSPDLCVGGRCLVGAHRAGTAPGTPPGPPALTPPHPEAASRLPAERYFGYMNVTKIPAGATHIKVTDKSRNYLALMTSNGRYVLNGDWSIAWPGPYEVAGTRLHYARAPDGTESLEAPGPTDEDLHVMVLLQEPNPGIEYEFWLPRGHPQPGRGDASPLRQPQPRGAGSPPPREPPVSLAPTPPPQPWGSAMAPPPRSPPGRSGAGAAAGRCGRCRPAKGRSQRIRHFCQSDFVFQGRILARRLVGQETRYEVEVKTPYRHRFPLVPREYVWVPNTCGCPPLREGGPVPADGAATRQLRAHAQPPPAAGRRLRPAVDAPRGPAGGDPGLLLCAGWLAARRHGHCHHDLPGRCLRGPREAASPRAAVPGEPFQDLRDFCLHNRKAGLCREGSGCAGPQEEADQAPPLPAGLSLRPGLLLEGPDLPGQGPGQDGGPGPHHPGLPCAGCQLDPGAKVAGGPAGRGTAAPHPAAGAARPGGRRAHRDPAAIPMPHAARRGL